MTQITTNSKSIHPDEIELPDSLHLLLDTIDKIKTDESPSEVIKLLDFAKYRLNSLFNRNIAIKHYNYYGLAELLGNINLAIEVITIWHEKVYIEKKEGKLEVAVKYFHYLNLLGTYSSKVRTILEKMYQN